jgi:hypothetical protein
MFGYHPASREIFFSSKKKRRKKKQKTKTECTQAGSDTARLKG